MKETEQEFSKEDGFPQLTPAEFELMLKRYGMTKAAYCQLRGKCRSWFYEGIRTKHYLTIADMEAFANEIGRNNFDQLVKAVRNHTAD
jgi:hypothetical protein